MKCPVCDVRHRNQKKAEECLSWVMKQNDYIERHYVEYSAQTILRIERLVESTKKYVKENF